MSKQPQIPSSAAAHSVAWLVGERFRMTKAIQEIIAHYLLVELLEDTSLDRYYARKNRELQELMVEIDKQHDALVWACTTDVERELWTSLSQCFQY